MNLQANRLRRAGLAAAGAWLLSAAGFLAGCETPKRESEPIPTAAMAGPSISIDTERAKFESESVRVEPAASDAGEKSNADGKAPTRETIRLAPGIEVDLAHREVRIAAQAALDEGWLEQAVCLAGTREHESLLVIEAPPRLVHAAMLLIGLEPGRPGAWLLADDGVTVRREPPTGDAIELLVEYEAPDGSRRLEPLSAWVETADGGSLPPHPWRFAGSRLEPTKDGGEIYAADFAGSIVGLVTFGDEVIAFEEVRSDRIEIEAAGFLVRRGAPPPPGTPTTLVVRRPPAR